MALGNMEFLSPSKEFKVVLFLKENVLFLHCIWCKLDVLFESEPNSLIYF